MRRGGRSTHPQPRLQIGRPRPPSSRTPPPPPPPRRCSFNYDPLAASRDIDGLVTPSKKMLPLRLTLFKKFFAAGAKLAAPSSALAGAPAPLVRGAVRLP